ncbi:hypothetical protein JABBAWOKKIE_61 [Mycobacterium phage Jabbawokkie]|uniref:Antirepressor n=1 Tax=Mycobacterium phage Zapner TaxID=1486474 RepID=A0A059VL24_9CAUD|nr:hypothetical protein N850_gp059 [Mycobacterium phage Jabbawokkie]YP_009963976.1 hypothetical protein I5I04_gp059 [Mycobacterium phage Zapner]AGT12160.1 hypothetical protein JABBAWOKKIE_61 [Mycobacterium phage Jabbawokkie]AHZ95513.1 hypothetical protein PBI_ZAPNER_59 [Mycobacterium phage Zapner]
MSELQLTGDQSPFDAIRRSTTEGREYWSARELMPLLGYDKWERFDGAVQRAITSLIAQGRDADREASRLREAFGRTNQVGDNYHLSRFACYLVAMNGDPRKPEVAAAQAYFAIRTRDAETAQAIDLSDPLAVIEAESARVQKAVEIARGERLRAEKAERKLEVEQRHRRAIEGGDGIHLTDFGKKYFSEVPARKFDEHLYSHGWLINQHNTRVRADGTVRDGYDHRKPTAKGRPYIYDHDQGNYGGRRRFQPRVRPQKEIELRDRLAAEGLSVNEHSTGLVLITNDDLKELGA